MKVHVGARIQLSAHKNVVSHYRIDCFGREYLCAVRSHSTFDRPEISPKAYTFDDWQALNAAAEHIIIKQTDKQMENEKEIVTNVYIKYMRTAPSTHFHTHTRHTPIANMTLSSFFFFSFFSSSSSSYFFSSTLSATHCNVDTHLTRKRERTFQIYNNLYAVPILAHLCVRNICECVSVLLFLVSHIFDYAIWVFGAYVCVFVWYGVVVKLPYGSVQ